MRLIYLGLTALLLAGTMTVTATRDAKAACVVGVASWDVLWIRSGPSTRYGKVGSIPANACGVRINWDDCSGAWCRVYYRGVQGWSSTRLLRG